MAVVSREQIKKAFEKGAIPSQEDFENLIDSLVHKQEDGLITQQGLKLSPQGSSKQMLSFFNNINDFKPTWSLEQHPKDVAEFGLNLVDQHGNSQLYINPQGYIGIGTVEPTTKLDVAGNIHMHGRRGMYAAGQVPGDGEWHSITPRLNHCHAFEVIAKVGKPGRGLYAMLHAFALSTFGDSTSSIKKTQAYYGSFRNKMDLRWEGTTFNYYLQIRTRRNYGEDSMISYYVTNLWWENN